MIEQTYHDLMSKLPAAQRAITQAREAYDQAVEVTKECERLAEDEKVQIVIFAGGYSKLGTNDKDREYKLAEILRDNTRYQAIQANLRNANVRKADAKRGLDNAVTDLETLRYQTSLTCDLMKYMALTTAKPQAAELLDL